MGRGQDILLHDISMRSSPRTIGDIGASHRLARTHSRNFGASRRLARTYSRSFGASHRLARTHSRNFGASRRLARTHSRNFGASRRLARIYSRNFGASHRLARTYSHNVSGETVRSKRVGWGLPCLISASSHRRRSCCPGFGAGRRIRRYDSRRRDCWRSCCPAERFRRNRYCRRGQNPSP